MDVLHANEITPEWMPVSEVWEIATAVIYQLIVSEKTLGDPKMYFVRFRFDFFYHDSTL